jgi:hypothetical protein
VVGRCLPDTEDPCRWPGQPAHHTSSPEYGLCEQRCSTYFGRVICTCYTGYTFNKVMLQET